MTTLEVKNKLKSVKSLEDFQELFFSDDGEGNMTPDFTLEFKTGDSFTDSTNAKEFDSNGSCVNSFIKCEDGHVKYPF